MWILLAISLLLLQFSKKIACIVLSVSVMLGILNHTIDVYAILFILGIFILYWLRERSSGRYLKYAIEIICVVFSLLLILHMIPGFHSLQVLDAVYVGPESTLYTMRYNFDKALVPFVLFACLPTLFYQRRVRCPGIIAWCLLVLSIPLLLFIATLAGGLRIESHLPAWIWQFSLANIFFVSLAEDAFFRGYLQQRLSGIMHPLLALLCSSIAFGAIHYAGGPLLMAFAAIAGIIYGLAWMWSGRLWLVVLFHFGLNLCHLLFFTYPALRHTVI